MLPTWLKTALNVVLAGLLLLVAFFTLDRLWDYVAKWLGYLIPIAIPFIVAIFMSFILEPMVVIFQERGRMSRGPAVALAMLLVLGFFGIIIVLLLLKLATELFNISKALPGIVGEIQIWLQESLPKLKHFYGELPSSTTTYIESSLGSFAQSLQGFLSKTTESILSIFTAVPGVVAFIIISLLATYFISKDRRLLARKWVSLCPAPYGERSLHIVREVFGAFISYIKAQGILVSITTFTSIVGLYIIGAEYALTMGLLIGFFDIIPVLGPATVFIPWIIWAFMSGPAIFAVKLLILYVIVLVTRQLLETKVVSHSLGLHPLATLVALFVGFKLLGFLGMILGPILLIAVQAFIKAGIPTSKVK